MEGRGWTKLILRLGRWYTHWQTHFIRQRKQFYEGSRGTSWQPDILMSHILHHKKRFWQQRRFWQDVCLSKPTNVGRFTWIIKDVCHSPLLRTWQREKKYLNSRREVSGQFVCDSLNSPINLLVNLTKMLRKSVYNKLNSPSWLDLES